MALDSVTDDQSAMLDLEAQWFATLAGKEVAIRDLGMSPVRYYQRLDSLLDEPAAVAYAPVVVHRFNRIRSRRVLTRR